MPGCCSRCAGRRLCSHDPARSTNFDDNDFEFVEVDPTGRYGRYDEVLGKGAFKTVYQAFDEAEGMEVAWNQVKVQDVLQTPEDLERLYSEVYLLKTLKHKNIIKFYYSWVDAETKNVNFITEIFTSGTLRQYRKRHKDVDIKAVKNWSRQILRGLLYLHSHDPPIIHRDLKCDNIFVNGNQGEVKIGDLGLATILRHTAAHSVIGTPEFMAPELYDEEYTELVDIYSFGMCLMEMVTFEYPYSECKNAAQIYKKVTSGKRPEALNKVRDPELRQFVEKCLATASRRLSARELLLDPFLQSEGYREVVDCLPPLCQTLAFIDDMADLGILMEEPGSKSACVKINYKDKDTLPNFFDSRSYDPLPMSPAVSHLKFSPGIDHPAIGKDGKQNTIIGLYHKHERATHRRMDLRVKGKRREDDSLFLRLRMADSEGHIRNIHFPFDVDGDTALCVASEMVAELDLTDHDVTKIAEIIDTAILALVPEWKPGVAIDESCGEGEVYLDHAFSNPVKDGHFRMATVSEPSFMVSPENSPLEHSSSDQILGCHPSGGMTSWVEGMMHGRFEEVTYYRHRPDLISCMGEHCTLSSGSSTDVLKGVDEWEPVLEVELSLTTDTSLQNANESEDDLEESSSKEVAAAFNELVESNRKAELKNCMPEPWKGIVSGKLCSDNAIESVQIPVLERLENAKFCWHNENVKNCLPVLSASSSLHTQPSLDHDGSDDLVAQELIVLVLRHEQELRELQQKHSKALLELSYRWQQKRSSGSLSASPIH